MGDMSSSVEVVPTRNHPKWTREALVAGHSHALGLSLDRIVAWDRHLWSGEQCLWFDEALLCRLNFGGIVEWRTLGKEEAK